MRAVAERVSAVRVTRCSCGVAAVALLLSAAVALLLLRSCCVHCSCPCGNSMRVVAASVVAGHVVRSPCYVAAWHVAAVRAAAVRAVAKLYARAAVEGARYCCMAVGVAAAAAAACRARRGFAVRGIFPTEVVFLGNQHVSMREVSEKQACADAVCHSQTITTTPTPQKDYCATKDA